MQIEMFQNQNSFLNVKHENNRTRCEIYSTLTNITEQDELMFNFYFIVNFEHNLHLVLTLSMSLETATYLLIQEISVS